jgi:hypothetical protein
VKGRKIGRYVVATSLILALGVPAAAVGFGEGRDVKGGKRNPIRSGYSAETEIISRNGSYGTRQSNTRIGDGGGAIYGCRSAAGNEPCVRGNNLQGGRAFEFNTGGPEAGFIEVGNSSGAPFQTNGTGLVRNLNAGRVGGKTPADLDDAQTLGGKSASDFAASTSLLFAIVQANGQAAGKGVTAGSVTGSTYTITFNRDVSGCAFTASPVGGGTATAPGVSPGSGANADKVTVQTGTAVAFHLQVMCA